MMKNFRINKRIKKIVILSFVSVLLSIVLYAVIKIGNQAAYQEAIAIEKSIDTSQEKCFEQQIVKKPAVEEALTESETADWNEAVEDGTKAQETAKEEIAKEEIAKEEETVKTEIIGTGYQKAETDNQQLVSKNEKHNSEKIQKYIDNMTLEEKVAQLFVITPEALTGVGTVVNAGDATKKALEKYPVGGIIYFAQNITSKDQVIRMLKNTQAYSEKLIGIPIFLGIDEEGGSVARIANSGVISVEKLPNMEEIGATKDSAKAYDAGVTLGTYLSELGFNLDFAPVADVLTNSDNTVVKKRSFGTDCSLVSQMNLQLLKGLNEQGIYGTIKHFPGHGSTAADTHKGYAYTNKTLKAMMSNEMVPFVEGIKHGVSFVMVGHISAPEIIGDSTPSSLSKAMITKVLRNKLGYDKVVITDALNMGAIQNSYTSPQAAVKAINAGVDLLLMPADFKAAYRGVLEAVKKGVITEARIDESLYRILEVKFRMQEMKLRKKKIK